MGLNFKVFLEQFFCHLFFDGMHIQTMDFFTLDGSRFYSIVESYHKLSKWFSLIFFLTSSNWIDVENKI